MDQRHNALRKGSNLPLTEVQSMDSKRNDSPLHQRRMNAVSASGNVASKRSPFVIYEDISDEEVNIAPKSRLKKLVKKLPLIPVF